MKKLIFTYFLFLAILFGEINDNLGIYSREEKKILIERIEQLEKSYGIDFIVYTSKEKEIAFEKKLKNSKKTVIIGISNEGKGIANVKLSLSNDLDISSYSQEVEVILDKLEVLISEEEYSDYTYELLANIADIVNLLELEKKNNQNESGSLIAKALIGFFKLILVTLVIAIGYFLYNYFKKVKNATVCPECSVNMIIDEEIVRGKNIMKVYKCSSCGKIKRVNSKI